MVVVVVLFFFFQQGANFNLESHISLLDTKRKGIGTLHYYSAYFTITINSFHCLLPVGGRC